MGHDFYKYALYIWFTNNTQHNLADKYRVIQRQKVSVFVPVKASIALAATWAVWCVVLAAIPLPMLGKVRRSCLV